MPKLYISSVVMIFVFLMFKYSPAVTLYSFNLIRSYFKSLLLTISKMVSSAFLKLLIFLSPVFTPPSSESIPVVLDEMSCVQIKQIGR